MENKTISLKLSSQKVLSKKFESSLRGYNALDVDEYLDHIIDDYKLVESNILCDKAYIQKLENEIAELKQKNEDLQIKNTSLTKKIAGISDVSEVNSSNIELLQRIALYEKELWKKGINPSKLKV